MGRFVKLLDLLCEIERRIRAPFGVSLVFLLRK
jgi:hypothetical protein